MDSPTRHGGSGTLRGAALLDDPVLNKGTAFTLAERKEHGLEGLLPATIERQLEQVMGHLEQKPSDLERYVYLMGLCDRNETLFYKTLMSDPARFVPTEPRRVSRRLHFLRRWSHDDESNNEQVFARGA